jgi:DNA-binding transcriptional LysR family regulator
VSYQVKSLEERLGAPLFVRERGRARLTTLGARLLPALSSAFDSIEAAFASHREEDETLLSITTTHTFANTWLAWRLGAFQMEHPDLAVRMTTSNELCDLRSGDALVVRLADVELQLVALGALLEHLADVGQSLGAVDARLAGAEQVEVRPVQNKD